MRTFILGSIAALVLAAPAGASTAPLTIAIRDPGFHWFYLGRGPSHRHYTTAVTRTGPFTLLNLDEAPMIIKGPGGTRIEKVGVKLTLTSKGTYRLTMVKQAPDDNH